MMVLHISPTEDGGRRLLHLRGELDTAAIEDLHTAANGPDPHRDPGPVILDLGEVTFVDSGGLRGLLHLHIVRERSGGLQLRNLLPAAMTLLEVANLLDLFVIERGVGRPPYGEPGAR